MKEEKRYIDKVLRELNILPKDQEQKNQLQELLINKLGYPSTQLAELHMQANRLGKLDCTKNNESREEKQLKKCHCCGFARQPQTIDMCTRIPDIRHMGVSTRLLFVALTHTIVALTLAFLIFSIYAMASNVLSCSYNPQNLNPAYQSARYYKVVTEWVFGVSLLSNISCMTSSRAYEIQCWLGLATIVVLGFAFAGFKMRKLRVQRKMEREAESVQRFTVLIQNMPVNIDSQELERQLREYQRSLGLKSVEAQREITVIKINRAAPFYLSSELFKDPKAKAIEKKYEKLKDKLTNLVHFRMKKDDFPISKSQRVTLYQQFERIKQQRIQIFKTTVLKNALARKTQSEGQIATAPTFVTFFSSYNKIFLLNLHSTLKKLLSSSCFHFQIPGSSVRLLAEIEDAPRPQQVIWTNLGQSRSELLKKKLLIIFITLVFLVGTGIGIYYLQKTNFQYALQNRNKSTLWFSLLISFIILFMNYIISAILIMLVKRERNITYMEEQRSICNKVTIGQIGHFIVVPLVFNLAFTTVYTGVVSLSQTVFFLGLQRFFVFPVLKILDPIYLIHQISKTLSKRPKSKIGKSQLQLNKKFHLLPFGLGFQFCYLICSILFTCFFAPLQPIIIAFAIAGLSFNFWVEKYCLFKRGERPVVGSRLVSISVNKFIGVGPILFGIGSLVWPYYIKRQFIGLLPCILQIVVSVLMYLTPLQYLIQRVLIKKQQQDPTQNEQKLFFEQKSKHLCSYEQLNYMTAHHFRKLKQQKQEQEQDKKTLNTGYLQIYQTLVQGGLGYRLIDTDSKSVRNVEAAGKGEGNGNGKEKREREKDDIEQAKRLLDEERIVYSYAANNNAELIDAVLLHLKENRSMLTGDQQEGLATAEHLHREKRQGDGTMENINELEYIDNERQLGKINKNLSRQAMLENLHSNQKINH